MEPHVYTITEDDHSYREWMIVELSVEENVK